MFGGDPGQAAQGEGEVEVGLQLSVDQRRGDEERRDQSREEETVARPSRMGEEDPEEEGGGEEGGGVFAEDGEADGQADFRESNGSLLVDGEAGRAASR